MGRVMPASHPGGLQPGVTASPNGGGALGLLKDHLELASLE